MMIYPLAAEIQGFYPIFGPTYIINNATSFIFVLPREAVGNYTETTATFYIKFYGGDYTMTYVRNTNMVHAEYSNPPSAAATAYNNFQDRNFVVMVEMSGDGSNNAKLTTHVNGELKAINAGYNFGWSQHVCVGSLFPGANSSGAVGWHQVMVLVFDEAERMSGRPRVLAEELRNAEFWRYNIVAQEVMCRPVILPTPVQPPPPQQQPQQQPRSQEQPPRAAPAPAPRPAPAPAPSAPRRGGDDD